MNHFDRRETFSGVEDRGGSVAVLLSPWRTRMVLSGEVDAGMCEEVVEAVQEVERPGTPVEVDTRSVTFMDSTVLALMARLIHRAPDRVLFIDPPDLVRFLLEITHIGDVVDVIDFDPGFPDTRTAGGVPRTQREERVDHRFDGEGTLTSGRRRLKSRS